MQPNRHQKKTSGLAGGQRYYSGFTLVELLVIVAIIAVLAALLLPALKSARNRAKTAQCASNERQIGVGLQLFLSDHNGYYPYAMPTCAGTYANPQTCGWNYTMNLYRALTPYLSPADTNRVTDYYRPNYRSLLQCPANPWPFPTDPNVYYGAHGFPPTSYMYNVEMFPLCDYPVAGSAPSMTSPVYWFRRVNLSEIQHPGAVAEMGEMPYSSTANNEYGQTLIAYPSSVVYVGFDFISWVYQATNPPPGYGEAYWKRPDCSTFNSAFHNLAANILFVDGHVDRLTKNTLFTYGQTYLTTATTGSSLPGNVFWCDGHVTGGYGFPWFSNSYPTAPWPWDP